MFRVLALIVCGALFGWSQAQAQTCGGYYIVGYQAQTLNVSAAAACQTYGQAGEYAGAAAQDAMVVRNGNYAYCLPSDQNNMRAVVHCENNAAMLWGDWVNHATAYAEGKAYGAEGVGGGSAPGGSVAMTLPEPSEDDYAKALVVFGSLLTAAFLVWGAKKLAAFFDKSPEA